MSKLRDSIALVISYVHMFTIHILFKGSNPRSNSYRQIIGSVSEPLPRPVSFA